MKLVILGYARSGKDTVAEMLQKHYPYKFVSSSLFACERAVFPTLSAKYGYKSLEECYADRMNHRKEWFDLIAQYNIPDLARLGKELFAENDIYVGLRNRAELLALKESGLQFLTLWVERSAVEEGSCTVSEKDADIIIENLHDLAALRGNVNTLYISFLEQLNGENNANN